MKRRLLALLLACLLLSGGVLAEEAADIPVAAVVETESQELAPFLLGDYAEIVLVDERYTAVSLPSLVDAWAADEVLMLREAGFGS